MNISSYSKRAIAYGIDLTIISSILILSFAVILPTLYTSSAQSVPLYIFAFIAIFASLTYSWLTSIRIGKHQGQTFGKQVMGIKVVKADGTLLSLREMSYRELIAKPFLLIILSSFFAGLFLLLNILFPLMNKDTQAVHDKMVKTIVVDVEE